ncbi:MAG: ATP synthase subunit I [Thiotrichaceae bacterium]|nr:ATP synthase subunit I [Thiotrichaceae bacterium]
MSQVKGNTGASKILVLQSLLAMGIAYAFYIYDGEHAAQAALYGGCMVIFNIWITNRRMQSAAKIAKISPGNEVGVFYLAAVQRFIFTLGFFMLGMGLLELVPVPMLIAFAIGHLGYGYILSQIA